MIDELKDGVQAIAKGGRDAVVGRLSSPVLGPFLLSWAAFNYRIFFILFSDYAVEARFRLVDAAVHPTISYLLGPGLLYPFAFTAGYILVLPWISEAVLRWNLFMARRAKNAELESSGKEILTRAEGDLRLRQIKDKDEKIAKLSTRAKLEEVKALGWRARARAMNESDPGGAESALREFLLSAAFSVRSGSSITGVLGGLIFFADESLAINAPYLSRMASSDRWIIRGLDLLLYSSGDDLVATLRFSIESAGFSGVMAGTDVTLVNEVFEGN